MNGFSIIIPTYNRATLLRIALESIQQLRIPQGWEAEILVINNNSTDDTPIVAKEANDHGPFPVRHITEKKQGLNHGRNQGIQQAKFTHLVYLDDDMKVDSGWLLGYVAAQKKYAPDCVVGPVDPWFEISPAKWMTASLIESVSSGYSQKGDQLVLVEKKSAHELPGCNFAVLRSAAIEAGGFHPALDRSGKGMLSAGDWEFGERLVLLGKQVCYSPACRIKHYISQDKLSLQGMKARWLGRGATARATARLRGSEPSLAKKVRMFFRMVRFFFRSLRFRLVGDKQLMATHWGLHAQQIRGFLFYAPNNIKPRVWPPKKMVIIE